MKNFEKGFVVPLLLAIIALLAIGGGEYVYQQRKSQSTQQQTVADNQISQININPDNNQAPDPTKGSSIAVLFPKTSDVLVAGQTYNITWKSTNVGNQTVFIDLLSEKNTLVASLSQAIPNSGSYSWKVNASTPNGNYKVVVATSENLPTGANVASGNSGLFSIISNVSAPNAPAITSVNPQIVYITGGVGMNDTLVTVTGTNFSEDQIYLINPVTGADVTGLSANTPSGNPSSSTKFQMKIPNFITPGAYALVVKNSVFGLKSNPVPFTVALKSTQSNSDVPVITSISPTPLVVGQTATIGGINFPVGGRGDPVIYIGSTRVNDVSGLINSTTNAINFTVPQLAPGTYNLYAGFYWMTDAVNNTYLNKQTNTVSVTIK